MFQTTGCVPLPLHRQDVHNTAPGMNVHQMVTVWMEQSAAQLNVALGAVKNSVSNLFYQQRWVPVLHQLMTGQTAAVSARLTMTVMVT